MQHCADSGQAYWAWTGWEWARLAGSGSKGFLDSQTLPTEKAVRPFLVALAYLLGGFSDFQHLGMFNRLHLARLVFGGEAVDAAITEVTPVLDRWGYRSQVRDGEYRLPGVLGQALLVNRSPRLQDLTTAAFARLHAHPATSSHHRPALYALQRAAADLGHCDAPVRPGYNHAPVIEGADPAWTGWVERWHATSTLTPRVRAIVRILMAKAGRWLAAEHPEINEPGQWTRQTCAAWVAAVDRMAVGDYVQRRDHLRNRAGKPIAPRTKAHVLMATRTFFRDCQEWEWFPRRFDPSRALAVPRSVNALIGTDPRVIADEVWAKLLWAGLNLEAGDLPGTSAGTYYPLELIRALTLSWLFSGLRSDELSRLRVGCIRWQHNGMPIPGDSREILAEDAICLLDVPVHKTGTAFTKPVDPIVGQAIEAWQARRPGQPRRLDRKTSEYVELLFSVRAHPVAKTYINRSIIPALCRKSRRPCLRRPRQLHQPPGPLDDRQPALQRKRADDAVRATGLAGTPDADHQPSTTPRSPPTPCPRPIPRPATSPATSAPSRSSSTGTPSPQAPPQPANPGSTTTSATDTAPTPSSSSARTAWPARNATSTPPRNRPRPSSWRPGTTSSGCSPPSRSPTTNAPPSMTGRPPWIPSSAGSLTSRPPQEPPPARSGVPSGATQLPIIMVRQGKRE